MLYLLLHSIKNFSKHISNRYFFDYQSFWRKPAIPFLTNRGTYSHADSSVLQRQHELPLFSPSVEYTNYW